MVKVLRKGNRKYLELEDLYRLDDRFTYEVHFNKFLEYKAEK